MKLAVNADKTGTMATNPNVSMSRDLVPKSCPRMRAAMPIDATNPTSNFGRQIADKLS